MEKRIEFISFEEFQKLYKGTSDKNLKLAMMLGYGSGLRISEIVGLRKKLSRCCKANLEMKRVEVIGKKLKRYYCSQCKNLLDHNQISYSNTEWKIPPLTKDKIDLQSHQIRLDLTKGGSWRVTITPPTLTENYINLLPLTIPRRTLQYQFDQLTKKILNKKMSFHILRHGFGNYQANVLNIPLPIVQQMMGHSRLDTTGIYTKANPEQSIKVAWEAMNKK